MTAQLAVVLVEPSGPLNVGSVARLCANFGVSSLRLVAPRCDPQDPQAKQMAVRGLEQLLACQLYPNLEAAVADCRRVVACSGRVEAKEREHLPPQAALQWLMEPMPGPSQVALVFGREDHGCTQRIEPGWKAAAHSHQRGLRVAQPSHAVAICLAEQQRQTRPARISYDNHPLPAHAALEAPCRMPKTCCWRWVFSIRTPPPLGWPNCANC